MINKKMESRQYETVKFIFLKAVNDIFKNYYVEIQNSLNNGAYSEIYSKKNKEIKILTDDELEKIKVRMNEIISENLEIKLITDNIDDLKKKAENSERNDIKKMLENCGWVRLKEYSLGDYIDYFYIEPESSTKKVLEYDIYKYENGIIFKTVSEVFNWKLPPYKDTPKIAKSFIDRNNWEKNLGINYVADINIKIFKDEIIEQILLDETSQDKKIGEIANEIITNKEIRIITIAGPSSSGKTTFSKKLELQLKTSGVKTFAISLDNYYVGRKNVPLDENGEKDFETIEALDLKLLNKNLEDLISKKETELPVYNFYSGEREKKYKIYISCLTQTNMDSHNRIHTTDVRKIRRIARDSMSRETSGEKTLKMWNTIRRGEEKWIFPFQEEADAIFNSSFTYELAVLKPYAIRELMKIKATSPEYEEAKKLASILNSFVHINPDFIPIDSILKEFIGNSIFYNY